MTDEKNDFFGDPWWKGDSRPEDYTKRRTGSINYTVDDIIGKKDGIKYKPVTLDPSTTVSGAGDLLTS